MRLEIRRATSPVRRIIRLVRAIAALTAFVGVGACGLARRAANAVKPQPDPPQTVRWNAVLFAPSDSLGDTLGLSYGTAWMASASPDKLTSRVRVAVVRVPPATVFTFRVQIGSCTSDEGMFGPPAAYHFMIADSSGVATDYVVLPLGFPNRGRYAVVVAATDTVAGGGLLTFCGPLIAPR
jgi:hypothetical protein